MKHPRRQKKIWPIMLPCAASFCWAIEQAWRRSWTMATKRDPKLMLPKLYVKERLNAPLVAALGNPAGFCE